MEKPICNHTSTHTEQPLCSVLQAAPHPNSQKAHTKSQTLSFICCWLAACISALSCAALCRRASSSCRRFSSNSSYRAVAKHAYGTSICHQAQLWRSCVATRGVSAQRRASPSCMYCQLVFFYVNLPSRKLSQPPTQRTVVCLSRLSSWQL